MKTSALLALPLGLLVLNTEWTHAAPLPGGTQDPTQIPKYVAPLVIPPAMPMATLQGKGRQAIDYYELAVRQFQQQIMPDTDAQGQPTNLPPTTVWSYVAEGHPETAHYPCFTIEARVNRPVRVKWINRLVDENGNFLPHLLPVDPTLHWANPPGPVDSEPTFTSTPGPYTGPVPIVTHLHEGHTEPESDGFPEAWYLPVANNIPAGFATQGSRFGQIAGVPVEPGAAVFQYRNDQRAAQLWFHDHTLGMTRLNVYAGPAGFYLLRGGPDDKDLGFRAPQLGDPPGVLYTEIPIAIQDRSFNDDGSLFYPDTRAFFDGITGPYVPFTDVPPIWNVEFFANTMVVNGNTWPVLNVEPRRYRLRFLDGCNARFLILKLVSDPLAERPAESVLPFWQIGNEGGFLPAPVKLDQLLMAPAVRADVIVDFSNLKPGTEVFLINEGPDEPFGGGQPVDDFTPADPGTTGQVMKFVVQAPPADGKSKPGHDKDQTLPPDKLKLPHINPLGPPDNTRQLSLNEITSEFFADAPIRNQLGTVENGAPVPLRWDDPITEEILFNNIEVWELHNFTVDAHPIHVHLVLFEVINREDMATGQIFEPRPEEAGFKDTIIALPGQITRIKAKFDILGEYVWHCHMVEHEDNEMMRPFVVVTSKDHPGKGPHEGDDHHETASDSPKTDGKTPPETPSEAAVVTPPEKPSESSTAADQAVPNGSALTAGAQCGSSAGGAAAVSMLLLLAPRLLRRRR